MSITLNHGDFQCLQDQLVDLKTKNYDLAEKNRRGQADFEAAKAKICSLQLKLEEQERDFQVTSSTLRREIEVAYKSNSSNSNSNNNDDDGDGGHGDNRNDGDYKTKYKKLLHKAKELQQRYEKSVEVVQQMDEQIKELTFKTTSLEEENVRLKQESADKQQSFAAFEKEYSDNLQAAIEEYKASATHDCRQHIDNLNTIKLERDNLQEEVDRLREEVKEFSAKLECQVEERKIQDRKGSQMIKELKRQLALEKNRNETIQKRLESLLSQPSVAVPAESASATSDLENRTRLSTSSSTNGNSKGSYGNGGVNGGSGGGSGSGANNSGSQQRDDNSVSSWSLVPGKTTSTPSICSIDSEGRETIHLPSNNCDTISESCLPIQGQQQQQQQQQHSTPPSPKNISLTNYSITSSVESPNKHTKSSSSSLYQNSMNENSDYFFATKRASSTTFNYNSVPESGASGMRFEDQAALMERVTRLQHDKWTLEEKLSYMEQANAALTQDLADKSHIIKQYFIEQALRSVNHHNHLNDSTAFNNNNIHANESNPSSRRVSFPNNINQLLTDKPSLKKMVDFLKERSQVSTGESENITREATKKMQVMLEETLIKCLKLQENLDFVTSELNKLQA